MKAFELLSILKDEKYAEFHAKLIPNIKRDTIIGVRVPKIRTVAKEFVKDEECEAFLNSLPHKFYDENMLHGLVISEINDIGEVFSRLDEFLPYIDNWAVCDSLRPKIFKKHKKELFGKIKEWTASKNTYTTRFGIVMLMTHFLDDDFLPQHLVLISKIKSDEYYINMAISWYYATALAKHWDETLPYIEKKLLPEFIHNKTIQKARESYRITQKQKEYLRTYYVSENKKS